MATEDDAPKAEESELAVRVQVRALFDASTDDTERTWFLVADDALRNVERRRVEMAEQAADRDRRMAQVG